MASAQTKEDLRKFRFVTSSRPIPWSLVRSVNIAQHRTEVPMLDTLSRISSELCDLHLDVSNLGLGVGGIATGGHTQVSPISAATGKVNPVLPIPGSNIPAGNTTTSAIPPLLSMSAPAIVPPSATTSTAATSISSGTSVAPSHQQPSASGGGGGDKPTSTDIVQLCHSLQLALQFSLFSQTCMLQQLRSVQQSQAVSNISSATLTTMEAKLDAANATIAALKDSNKAVNEELSQRHFKYAQAEKEIEVLKAKVQAAEDELSAVKKESASALRRQKALASNAPSSMIEPAIGGAENDEGNAKKQHRSSCSKHHRYHHHHRSHRESRHHRDPNDGQGGDDISSNQTSTSLDESTPPQQKRRHHSSSKQRTSSRQNPVMMPGAPGGGGGGQYVDWASFAGLMMTQQQLQQQHNNQQQQLGQTNLRQQQASSAPPPNEQQKPAPVANQQQEPSVITSVPDPQVTIRLNRLDELTQTQTSNQALLTQQMQELVSSQKQVSASISNLSQDMQSKMQEMQATTLQGIDGLREEVQDVKKRQEALEGSHQQLAAAAAARTASGLKPPLAATPTSKGGDGTTASFSVANTKQMTIGGGQSSNSKRASIGGVGAVADPLDEVSFGELHSSVNISTGSVGINNNGDTNNTGGAGGAGGRGPSAAPSPNTMQCEFCSRDFPQATFQAHVERCSAERQRQQEEDIVNAGSDDETPAAGPPKCVHCGDFISIHNRSLEADNACQKKCQHCRQSFICYEWELHEAECDLRTVKCRDCGKPVCAKLMGDHMVNKCPGPEGARGSSVGGGDDMGSLAGGSKSGTFAGIGTTVVSMKGNSTVGGGTTLTSQSSVGEGRGAGGTDSGDAILPRKESDLEKAKRELQELLAEEAAAALAKRKKPAPVVGADDESASVNEPREPSSPQAPLD